MLKGISKIVSPQLLKILCEMGHGDEIVIADGNFPSETNGQRVIRADGIGGVEMLDAVLSLIPLDTYAEENFLLMQTTQGDPTPTIWEEYFSVAKKRDDNLRAGNLERFAFYERAKNAYAVIATGEGAVYANIILKKGVIK
jgi:L-fucose mutarotase